MPKIKDYPNITEFTGDEVFLVEAPEGTRSYTYEQLRKLFLNAVNEVSGLSHFTELTGTVDFESIEAQKIYLVGASGAEFTDGEQMFALSENDILIGSPEHGVTVITSTGSYFISATGTNVFEKSNLVTQEYVEKLLAAKENVQPKWRKICSDTLTDDAAEYIRSLDESGNALNLSKAKIILKIPENTAQTDVSIRLHTPNYAGTDDEEPYQIDLGKSNIYTSSDWSVISISVDAVPFLSGFVQSKVSYFITSGGSFEISSSNDISNKTSKLFDFDTATSMNLLHILPSENNMLPQGMIVELWGVDINEG